MFLITTAFFLASLFPAAVYDVDLLTNPPAAPLPAIESWQYITGYPGSYGFAPIYKYLDQKLTNGPITLFVQGSQSHFPNAFRLYFWRNPRITIIEKWPLTAITPDILAAEKYSQVFLVVRHNQAADESDILKQLQLTVLMKGMKPRGQDSVYLTKIQWK